jgi:hypothetical protein
MYPGCPDTSRHVLIECDWYTPTGVSTPSGLLQVSLDEELSKTNRWTFLKNMHRANIVLWPAYAHSPEFAVIPNTFAIITHTTPEFENHADNNHANDDSDDDEHNNVEYEHKHA